MASKVIGTAFALEADVSIFGIGGGEDERADREAFEGTEVVGREDELAFACLLYTSPSPRDS